MMACSAACHKKAKKQRRASLATLQPQTDTDMANSKVAALTESKDFPLPAPTQLLHKRAMPEGSKTGLHVDESQPSETDIHVDLHVENSQPEKQISQSSKIPSERPNAHRKLSFYDDNLFNIGSDQVDTSPSSVQDSRYALCTWITVRAEYIKYRRYKGHRAHVPAGLQELPVALHLLRRGQCQRPSMLRYIVAALRSVSGVDSAPPPGNRTSDRASRPTKPTMAEV